MTREQLEDEITSVNAIYDTTVLERTGGSNVVCLLTLPTRNDITVRLEFQEDYPDSPPSVLGTHATGSNVAKGEGSLLVEALRTVLAEVFNPGVPCVFDLVEETTARYQQFDLSSTQSDEARPEASPSSGQNVHAAGTIESNDEQQRDESESIVEPPWTISDVVTEKKSVFVARVAMVSSPQEAKRFLHHLLATDKKAAKATHNITAWRIKGDSGVQFQDCDDDGETAAGGRLLHLLELMGTWNAMVVVTRWYGGVHLGPDRFRIINQVARDAVVKAGLADDTPSKKGKK